MSRSSKIHKKQKPPQAAETARLDYGLDFCGTSEAPGAAQSEEKAHRKSRETAKLRRRSTKNRQDTRSRQRLPLFDIERRNKAQQLPRRVPIRLLRHRLKD